LTILADLKARRGQIAEANALYKQAEGVIEGMLTSVDEPYWTSSVVASMSQTYLRHFELVARTGDVPTAFRVLEQVRGRTLAWALKDKDRNAIPASQLEQTASLETDVAGLQARLMQTSSANEREQLLDKLAEYERRLGLAWTKRDANIGLPIQPAPLKVVQNDLKPNEVLLEYVLDDPTSFCISTSRKGAFVRVLPASRKEIESLAQAYIDQIRKRSGADVSKQLYELLIKPIPEALGTTRFLIVPDGILNLLPFEALRDDQGQYLLKSRTISYVPSGTILHMLRRRQMQERAPKPLLAVGDVAYENQGGAGRSIPPRASVRGRIERGIADLSGIGLHDLPQTREEVLEIGKVVGPDAVVNGHNR